MENIQLLAVQQGIASPKNILLKIEDHVGKRPYPRENRQNKVQKDMDSKSERSKDLSTDCSPSIQLNNFHVFNKLIISESVKKRKVELDKMLSFFYIVFNDTIVRRILGGCALKQFSNS